MKKNCTLLFLREEVSTALDDTDSFDQICLMTAAISLHLIDVLEKSFGD